MKHSFKRILSLMARKQTYIRTLSAVVMMVLTVQLAVVPVEAKGLLPQSKTEESGNSDIATPENESVLTEPALQNTYALVVTTGGQSGDAIQYFKVIYEDTDGIRRSEYILKDDNKGSFEFAQEFGNVDSRRSRATGRFWSMYNWDQIGGSTTGRALQAEKRDTYLFETLYDVERVIGLEIMQNAGQWDCQGLWLYQVDQIYGEEMYGYVSGDAYVNFSGWRLAELEMKYSNGQLIYTTLQNSRPKLYRMGENGHPEFNLIIYDRSEAPYDSTNNSREYAMRLDITDVYGAGIEAVGSYISENDQTIGGTHYKDTLKMDIRYQDTFGCVQTISVNVMPSSLLWALDNGVPESTKLAGYAQQGDTLLFPLKIPYFADLLKVSLHCQLPASNDAINFSSIAMYDLTLSLADVTVDPAREAIVPSITYNPVYLWKTNSRQGYTMNHLNVFNCEMRLNEESLAIVDEPLEDEYLVEINTDDMPSAGTTEDVSILLNYETYGGMEQRTEKIMLREQSKDFHGYTPGGDDMYYWMAMRPGGTLHFRIKIPYVSKFTGATFEMESGGADEWQMGGLKIYRLDEVSRREITRGDFIVDEIRSDRYYDRSFEGELVFSGTKPILVQKGDPITMDTSENGGAYSESILPEASVAWGDIKYSMSYEEALQDIGFTTTRNTYQVEVTVAGNTALAGTEDAGSKNQFYFQLIFQDGTSGYVLANQQLSGDGFRSGYNETFSISTNQDYGELVSVRIIPEDISSKSDYFDKLNIDSIQVTRNSDGGLSRQWSLERIGWIDIDFRDEGAASGMLGQSGRTEEQMARTFNVTYSTYAVNLLVSLTTLGMPFSGSVHGDICYYSGSGETKHKSFDVVKLMYEYAQKTPRYDSDANGSTSGVTSAVSDSFMFRADKTDRFIVTLSDVRELAYLELSAYMNTLKEGEGGTWHIGGAAVSLIESEGTLLLNANDEYERSNTVHLLTSNVDTNRTPAYQMLLEYNATSSQRIYFIENQIDLDINHDNISVLAREPISQNDVLNIYVYPDLEKSEDSTEYALKAAATYTSPHGMRQASGGELTLSSDGTMFYTIGVKASGMTVLNDLTIQAISPDHIPNAYIDRAIVQQVRSGVIINTYEFDFHGTSAAYSLSSAPITESPDYEATYINEQVVMFNIGTDFEEMVILQPEVKDVAVALRYIPEYTAETYEQEFDTPYIYLTDQQITTLRAGQVVTLTFREDYIREITGVVLVATGGMTIPIDMACVGTYRVATATGERVEDNWYSFSEFLDNIIGTEVGRTDRQLIYSGKSVKPLNLQFVTAPATMDAESGISGSVELTISYVDDYGTIRTETIPDLKRYATTPTPFATDTVTDVSLLVAGMKELRWLEVRPYDDDAETEAGWRLSSISAQLGYGSEVRKRSVDDTKAILESTGRKINFSTVSVHVNVKAQSNTGKPTNVDAVNETVNILLDSGQSAQLKVEVTGSDEGFTVKAERSNNLNADATADASDFLTRNGNTITFSPSRNYTGGSIYYRITVTSVEVGTKTVINFDQSFEKEPEKVVWDDEDEEDEAADDTAGDSGGDSTGEADSGAGSETP